MDKFEIGAGITLGLAFFGLIVWMHCRLRTLESITLVEKEKIIDDTIVSKNHALTDSERDALLRDRLDSGNS